MCDTVPRIATEVGKPVDNYKDFRQGILNSRVLMCRRYYLRNGYTEYTIRQWFRQLVKDHVIEKQGFRYVLRPIGDYVDNYQEIKAPEYDASYEDFKAEILKTGILKSQVQHSLDGYPYRKVQRWFRQLVAEGIIEKANRRFYLLNACTEAA